MFMCGCAHVCLCVCPSAVGNSNQPKGQSANQSCSEKDQGPSGRSGCTETDEEIKSGRQTRSGTETDRWLGSRKHADRCDKQVTCKETGMQRNKDLLIYAGYKASVFFCCFVAVVSFDHQNQVAIKLRRHTESLTWSKRRAAWIGWETDGNTLEWHQKNRNSILYLTPQLSSRCVYGCRGGCGESFPNVWSQRFPTGCSKGIGTPPPLVDLGKFPKTFLSF